MGGIKVDELKQEIVASLSNNSKFTFYDDCRIIPHGRLKVINKDELQRLYVSGSISVQHAFVLRAINALSHATSKMILQLLQLQRRITPRKDIMDYTDKQLGSLLEYLGRNGLVFCYEYMTADGSKILIYTCSSQGYQFFKNRLEVVDAFDDSAVFRGDHDIFKRLACNSVALALAQDNRCVDCVINGRFSMSTEPKKFSTYIYAAAEFMIEGKKKLFIIEPTYFSIDYDICTDEEEMLKINNRITKLAGFIDKYKETSEDTVIPIMCVEGVQSLKQLGRLLKSRDDNISEIVLATSENILFKNRYALERSFIKFTIGDKITVTPVGSDWL